MVHVIYNAFVLVGLASLDAALVYHNGPRIDFGRNGCQFLLCFISPALNTGYKFYKKLAGVGTQVVIDIKCKLASVRRSDELGW